MLRGPSGYYPPAVRRRVSTRHAGRFFCLRIGDSPRFEGAVLTSVVPSLTPVLCSCAAEFSQNPPLVAHAGLASGLRLGISQTGTLGMEPAGRMRRLPRNITPCR